MKKYIGDKKFYKMVLAIAIPIMIQNGITNFVSLLDNVMVGIIGTEPMSGVAIANQILFVFNMCTFGGVSGIGIFTAQFFGKRDENGVRYTFRFKLITCMSLCVIMGIAIFVFGEKLLRMFLTGEADAGNIEETFMYGQKYLRLMALQLVPFAFTQAYASSLRECGNTKIPMVASMIAVAVNMSLNWVLIYGKLGFPRLGVVGAAIATIIARFTEFFVIVIAAHRNKDVFTFLNGAYKSLYIPFALVKQVSVTGFVLLFNELFWSSGMAVLAQCYSVRGLSVIAAQNISSTVTNLFSVAYQALGNAVAIIIGQLLGAGKLEEAKEKDKKLLAFAVVSGVLVGAILAVTSPLIPRLYNTTDDVRALASVFIMTMGCLMPLHSYNTSAYFTLRSGGKVFITCIFDSVFMWCMPIPVAFILSRFTGIPIVWLFLITQGLEVFKCVVGTVLLKTGIWVKNIVSDDALSAAD